jgi:hypothetical protein
VLVLVLIRSLEPSDSLVSGPCPVCASTLDLLGNPSFLVLSLETADWICLEYPSLLGVPWMLLGASSLIPLPLFSYSSCQRRGSVS